jgi:hypothetical protein
MNNATGPYKTKHVQKIVWKPLHFGPAVIRDFPGGKHPKKSQPSEIDGKKNRLEKLSFRTTMK